jgi:hypothetical protein
MAMTRRLARLVICVAMLLAPLRAEAAPPNHEAFQRGVAALDKGEFQAAIDAFEALADRGFVHPDASFDRGLAYLMRVHAKAEVPGDLGRAAAGFQEALLLRPDDAEADAALDAVRAEVTRRRQHRAKDVVDVRPTLDRVVVRLASERTWGVFAMSASMLLALGLLLRRREARMAHVAGSVLAPAAAVALFVFVPLTWAARHFDRTTRLGVVVAPELYLTTAAGVALQADAIAEAAAVEVSEQRGGLLKVRHGATEGWASSGSVRVLGPPSRYRELASGEPF